MTTEHDQFEELFQDWMAIYGVPTWDAEAEMYKEREWQMAFAGWYRGAGFSDRGRNTNNIYGNTRCCIGRPRNEGSRADAIL